MDYLEADDLIMMLTRPMGSSHSFALSIDDIIVSTDLDFVQLVRSSGKIPPHDVRMYSPIKDTMYFEDKKGGNIYAGINRIAKSTIEYQLRKILCGDSSDNLPGVPGIGDVSANKVLEYFYDSAKVPNDLYIVVNKLVMLAQKPSGRKNKSLDRSLGLIVENAASLKAQTLVSVLDLSTLESLVDFYNAETVSLGGKPLPRSIDRMYETLGLKVGASYYVQPSWIDKNDFAQIGVGHPVYRFFAMRDFQFITKQAYRMEAFSMYRLLHEKARQAYNVLTRGDI